MNLREATRLVLSESPLAMSARDVWTEIVRRGFDKQTGSKGKTPDRTVSAYLSTASKVAGSGIVAEGSKPERYRIVSKALGATAGKAAKKAKRIQKKPSEVKKRDSKIVANIFTSEKAAGWVYILTNPSFREDWVKIGKSARPVYVRLKELDNTAVPLPFEIFATLKTSKYEIIEKKIHHVIDKLTKLRIRPNREFFNIKPEDAFDILKDEATVLDDAVILRYKDNKPIADEPIDDMPNEEGLSDGNRKRPRFRFGMVGIPVGAQVVFAPTGTSVKVASDNEVEYKGRVYKLSQFARAFMPKKLQTASGAYQGAKYFTYRNRILDDLRSEKENQQRKP